MQPQVEVAARDALQVEDATQIQIMGFPVLEALPSRRIPYNRVDPFLLVHEGRMRLSEVAKVDTRHPHRGFDNLWYVLEGSVSTGHSTGPGGAMERARLSAGALLALRTGRGAWHAEAVGADERTEGDGDTEFRGVLFWVNLARKDKQAAPSAQVVQPEQIPVRQEGDAIVRVLVGEGSPVRLGTPALILDLELPTGGQTTIPVPPGFQGFAYVLEGEAAFAANRRPATPARLVLLGPGNEFAVTDATPGTRFLLMTGQPYKEIPLEPGLDRLTMFAYRLANSVRLREAPMAKQLRAQIDIHATPERVWRVLTDFAAYPQWNPFLTRADGNARRGERLTIRLQPVGGRGMTFRPTVLEATPAARLRWLGHLLVTGIFDGEHSFTIQPLGQGQVRLVQQEDYRGLLVPLMARSLDRRTLPAFEQMNQALKRRAEQPQP